MELFIDDEREQPMGWTIARSNASAIAFVNKFAPNITAISFDHDNGDTHGGFMPSVREVIKLVVEGKLSRDIVFTVHSSNPVGAKRIADEFSDIGVNCKRVVYENNKGE